jgi:hypothetical protein
VGTVSGRWSEANLPSAQDVEGAESTLSRLTRDGLHGNTDFTAWVNACITVEWAAAQHEDAEGVTR